MTPAMSLAGRRIVVTRPKVQASEFIDLLRAQGAEPILFPAIETAPLADNAALDHALREAARYDWIIFTSVNGVAAVWDRLQDIGLAASALAGVRMAAIGPATAAALEARGVRAAFVPAEYVAEAIAAGLQNVAGRRILLPRADIARKALADDLRLRGAVVDEVAAYQTLPAQPDPAGTAELRRGVDAITFTSSSTVRNFAALLEGDAASLDPAGERLPGPAGGLSAAMGSAVIACIGPITAQTAQAAGLRVAVVARQYTTPGLVTALVEYFGQVERPPQVSG